jgi:hypothetical protein
MADKSNAAASGDDTRTFRRFHEIRPAARMVDGQPAAPRFRVLPVPTNAYLRGSATREVTAGFLFEEALRVFNFGTQGDFLARKLHAPLTAATIRHDLLELHGPLLSKALHTHADVVSRKGVNGTKDGKRGGARIGKDVVQAPLSASDPYLKRLLLDNHQNAILLPRLWCDTWASKAARPNIIDFRAIGGLHRDVLDRLRHYTDKPNVLERSFFFRDRNGIPAVADAALLGADRVGNVNTVTIGHARAIDWLGLFARGAQPEAIGLTERIYATLVVLRTMKVEALPIHDVPFAWDDQLNGELAKLRSTYPLSSKAPPPYPVVRGKEGAWSQLDRWRRTAKLMKAEALGFLRVIPDVITEPAARGPIHSDLMWGVIMLEYMHLLLLHLQVIALYASVPFRQIYEGGYLAPLSKSATVEGLSGPMAVALWEYFAYPGIHHAHAGHGSARNSFTDFPRYVANKAGMLSTDAVQAADKASALFAPDQTRLAPWTGPVTTFGALSNDSAGVLVELNGPGRTVDLLAAANSQRVAQKPLAKSWTNYRTDLAAEFAKSPGLSFRRRFPIPYPVNPEYHRSIFNLPSSYTPGTRPKIERRLLQGWGSEQGEEAWFAQSQANHAAKLEAQLQLFVFAWLVDTWRQDRATTARPASAAFPDRLVLTCGSALYGGTFTPHRTHRDGYGHDISLTTGKKPYHYSTYWPLVDEDSEAKLNLGELPIAYLLVPGLYASPRARAVTLQNALSALMKNKNTQHEVKATLKDVFDLRFGTTSASMPSAVTKMKISAIVPTDALVVAGFDPYTINRPSQPGHANRKPPRFAFRELLREALQDRFNYVWIALSHLGENAAAIDNTLRGIEEELRDWPVFPDSSAHVSHHAAHAALILSQPVEFIWGAPIYHVRAIRAIAKGFFEKGRGNAFVRYGDSPPDRPIVALPEFRFMPHDHHHHWHVNFWRDPEGLPPRFQRRTHADHISRSHRIWRALGVDFGGFIYYLERLELSLRDAAGRSKEDPNGAAPIVKAAAAMRKDLSERNAAMTADTWAAGTDLRNAVFEAAESMGRGDVGELTNGWTTSRPWPVRDSILDAAIRKSEKIHTYIGQALTRAESSMRQSAITNERLEEQRETHGTDPSDADLNAAEAVQRAEQREAYADQAANTPASEEASADPAVEDPDLDDRAGAPDEVDIMDLAGSR